MDIKELTGHIKEAKRVFSETSAEVSKAERRGALYTYFKENWEEIKAAITSPDKKGNDKPKYGTLKKFLLGEGIISDEAAYNRYMNSINYRQKADEKVKAEQEREAAVSGLTPEEKELFEKREELAAVKEKKERSKKALQSAVKRVVENIEHIPLGLLKELVKAAQAELIRKEKRTVKRRTGTEG